VSRISNGRNELLINKISIQGEKQMNEHI